MKTVTKTKRQSVGELEIQVSTTASSGGTDELMLAVSATLDALEEVGNKVSAARRLLLIAVCDSGLKLNAAVVRGLAATDRKLLQKAGSPRPAA